jgi:hypothetical protein
MRDMFPRHPDVGMSGHGQTVLNVDLPSGHTMLDSQPSVTIIVWLKSPLKFPITPVSGG